MKVIKWGKIRTIQRACSNCGTEVEADKHDIRSAPVTTDPEGWAEYFVNCPLCGEKIEFTLEEYTSLRAPNASGNG